MPPSLGYLLPTRERIMEGKPEASPMLALAERAEELGFDSVWVGDSLTSRPRHEPLALLAGVAGRTRRVALGTAVLLPALRHPILMAQQIATLDQISEGRVILGVGIAQDLPNIRAEFAAADVPWEKRIGRMIEGLQLCRALWTGEPVNWEGRWKIAGETIAPTPHRPGGPPIWSCGMVRAALRRIARHFDGWLPNGTPPTKWRSQWNHVRKMSKIEGRNSDDLTGALYLTVSLDDDEGRALKRAGSYLERYYGRSAEELLREQPYYAGGPQGVSDLLARYGEAGVKHFVLRFVGDHDRHMEAIARVRSDLGW